MEVEVELVQVLENLSAARRCARSETRPKMTSRSSPSNTFRKRATP